jgi:hypothetical protein
LPGTAARSLMFAGYEYIYMCMSIGRIEALGELGIGISGRYYYSNGIRGYIYQFYLLVLAFMCLV